MTVASFNISRVKAQADGVRCDFEYKLVDGRVFTLKSVHCENEQVALDVIASKVSALELDIKSQDAQEAVQLGINTEYMTASLSDVYYAYLFEGYNEVDIFESYLKMSKVAPKILAMGLTVDQMATMFNQPKEMAQSVLTKWGKLLSVESEILTCIQMREVI